MQMANRPTDPGKEGILSVLTTYCHGGHLCHVTKIIVRNFCSLNLWRPHYESSFQSVVSEEQVFENIDGPTMKAWLRSDLVTSFLLNMMKFRT